MLNAYAWICTLTLLLTRAAVLDPLRHWLMLALDKLGISDFDSLDAMRCPMCIGFWVFIGWIVFHSGEAFHAPLLAYLSTLFTILLYDLLDKSAEG